MILQHKVKPILSISPRVKAMMTIIISLTWMNPMLMTTEQRRCMAKAYNIHPLSAMGDGTFTYSADDGTNPPDKEMASPMENTFGGSNNKSKYYSYSYVSVLRRISGLRSIPDGGNITI